MINKDLEEFPDHRTNFFKLIQAVTGHCFTGTRTRTTRHCSRIISSSLSLSLSADTSSSLQAANGRRGVGLQTHHEKCSRDRSVSNGHHSPTHSHTTLLLPVCCRSQYTPHSASKVLISRGRTGILQGIFPGPDATRVCCSHRYFTHCQLVLTSLSPFLLLHAFPSPCRSDHACHHSVMYVQSSGE